MSRWRPYAAPRSNERRGLTSRKWKWLVTVMGTAAVFATSTSTTSSRARATRVGGRVGVGVRRDLDRAGCAGAERAAADRVGHDDEPCAVVEHRLDLDVVQDVGDAGQHVVRAEHGTGPISMRLLVPPPVAGRLGHGVGDERRGLGDVEPETARASGIARARPP